MVFSSASKRVRAKWKSSGLIAAGDLIQVQRTVRLHFQRLRLDRTQHRRTAAFVFVGVGLLTDDVFLAALTMGHQCQQVAHGAGGHEQRRGKAQALGQFGFQLVDAGIFAIHVIAADGALAMASSMPGVGWVTVSLRRSITVMKLASEWVESVLCNRRLPAGKADANIKPMFSSSIEYQSNKPMIGYRYGSRCSF